MINLCQFIQVISERHLVLIFNSNSFFWELLGIAGWYAIQAQQQGLIGIRYTHRI